MSAIAPPTAPDRVNAFTYSEGGSWNIRLNERIDSLAYLTEHHGLNAIVAKDGESIPDIRHRGLAEMRRRGISPAESC